MNNFKMTPEIMASVFCAITDDRKAIRICKYMREWENSWLDLDEYIAKKEKDFNEWIEDETQKLFREVFPFEGF